MVCVCVCVTIRMCRICDGVVRGDQIRSCQCVRNAQNMAHLTPAVSKTGSLSGSQVTVKVANIDEGEKKETIPAGKYQK